MGGGISSRALKTVRNVGSGRIALSENSASATTAYLPHWIVIKRRLFRLDAQFLACSLALAISSVIGVDISVAGWHVG
jgi:hypothetical protein